MKKKYNVETLAYKGGGASLTSELSLQVYDSFLENCHYDRIQKIAAKYEHFKLIHNVPGDIVECGVHYGSGIYLYSKLLKIFKPNSLSKIVGFDFFEKNRKIKSKYKEDKIAIDEHQTNHPSDEKILKNLAKLNIDNVELISGDVSESTKSYVKENLGFRISLLILDVDNYEGTLNALKNLYDNVVRGGVIVFDEYSLRTYGESDAVDQFFKNKKLKLKNYDWCSTPSAYCIKE